MSHFRLKVNGDIEFDGQVGEWLRKPPDFVEDHLRPGAAAKPYMKCVMIVFTESVMTNRSVAITVTHNEKQWSMTVENV